MSVGSRTLRRETLQSTVALAPYKTGLFGVETSENRTLRRQQKTFIFLIDIGKFRMCHSLI